MVFEKEQDDVTGDVIFTVKIEPHPIFSIKGYNLQMCHPISLHEALTGVVLTISMPDGRNLNLSIEEVRILKTLDSRPETLNPIEEARNPHPKSATLDPSTRYKMHKAP